jgi:sulfopropanediol 3-dehydrogenase
MKHIPGKENRMYYKEIKKEKPVAQTDLQKLQETVSSILQSVRKGGDRYLDDYYTKKLGGRKPKPFLVSPKEVAKAKDRLSPQLVDTLDFAIERITAFAQAQKDSLKEFEKEMLPGMIMGQRIIPVASCGCYIPGGNYPNLATGLMTVIPAKVAGVQRIVCCSPGEGDKGIHPGILYPLFKLGIDEIYSFGGANAIGVLAFGTESIRPVDLVVGPGNQYVTEAKRQVYGMVGIDFLAGPSEILIIADKTARADFLAADLIAQCEHDQNARGALVATSEPLAHETLKEIDRQLKNRTTQEIARTSWENKGIAVVVENLRDAARYADEYAPEHLEIHTSDPKSLLPLLHNYGSVFLGENTAEVYADKVIGLNHVLPTGATARYTGGLWVGMYLKTVTHMMFDVKASLLAARHTDILTSAEGMDGHRYSAVIRLENLKSQ